METILSIFCILLGLVVLTLVWKVYALRKAADELREEFAVRLQEDTNVGIDISTSDKKMRRLAADMDRQIKQLRKEHLRYEQGDAELKNAVTNISHDLRTPLTAIRGYLDLLAEEEMSEEVREYLSIIENRVDAMKGLTEELFRYSVVLSGPDYEERERVSLNGAVEEALAAYYGALKEAGIEPEIELPEMIAYRNLNRQALARILANIISNAIKYSDGDFSVRLGEDGRMCFQNSATNLDEIQVGHLFDRFYTVESGTRSTGIGLSIAKSLTEALGGSINAEYRQGKLVIELKFWEN